MPTIIMDSCNYTRLGLMDYMATKGVKKKNISSVNDIEQLQIKCQQVKPRSSLLMKSASFMRQTPASVFVILFFSTLTPYFYIYGDCQYPF